MKLTAIVFHNDKRYKAGGGANQLFQLKLFVIKNLDRLCNIYIYIQLSSMQKLHAGDQLDSFACIVSEIVKEMFSYKYQNKMQHLASKVGLGNKRLI